MPNPIVSNPNAAVGGASGSGLGVLIVWAANHFGAGITPEVASVIAGVVAAVVLFIGRNGVKGAIRLVWNPKKS